MHADETGYTFIEHTADLGVRATAANLPDLFIQAAKGMYALLGRLEPGTEPVEKILQLQAPDAESLLHDWLSELLWELDGNGHLFDSLEFEWLDEQHLTARCRGTCYDRAAQRTDGRDQGGDLSRPADPEARRHLRGHRDLRYLRYTAARGGIDTHEPRGTWSGPLEKIGESKYRIPKSYKPFMRVDGIIYADDALIGQIAKDKAPEQVANVASLPGIVGASLAMPDIHWGYGFCIGGVAATDPAEGGVITPGGVGYDINCGVRLLRTNLTRADVEPRAAGADRRPVPRRAHRRGRGRQDQVHRQGDPPDHAARAALAGRSRLRLGRGRRTVRGAGTRRGRRPRRRQRARARARPRPVRHARQRQPLHGGPVRRADLRRADREGLRPARRTR